MTIAERSLNIPKLKGLAVQPVLLQTFATTSYSLWVSTYGQGAFWDTCTHFLSVVPPNQRPGTCKLQKWLAVPLSQKRPPKRPALKANPALTMPNNATAVNAILIFFTNFVLSFD
jgi:hypothetical protein